MVINNVRPLDFMIPQFLAHTSSPNHKVRASALSCTIIFISPDVNSLTPHLDTFMISLFSCATDTHPDVRKLVCQALVALLASRPDVLLPNMSSVVEFMLFSTQDPGDEEVALEACEFWLTFAEDPELVDQLRVHLPKVIPVLLDCMVYSEDDIAILDTDDDDAHVADKASDIKPHFLASKNHVSERIEDPANPGAITKSGRGAEEEEEESDDDYEEEEEDDETYTEWNLRKCSAAAIDVMAVAFEQEMLDVLLPCLKMKLFSEKWTDRESAILALGAIAEGEFVPQHRDIVWVLTSSSVTFFQVVSQALSNTYLC